jgi:predicted nucleotidyltransferase
MNDVEVMRQAVLIVRGGSHAYGLNIETSDEDYRGICILGDPRYYFGTQRFEQKDSWEDGADRVVYDIRKFFSLALACNPNIIEILFTDEEDIISITEEGQRIRDNRGVFLSKKAAKTFVGYAVSQLKRIQGHKRWLDNPPTEPKREDFLHEHSVDEHTGVWTRTFGGHDVAVSSSMPSRVTHFDGPGWDAAQKNWKNYQTWKKNRNPARAELEVSYGFDGKHAMHLIRLLRMGAELLETGIVNVKRKDREELLDIRRGRFSYESLLTLSEGYIARVNELTETSDLPAKPNHEAAEQLLVELISSRLMQ